MHKKVFSTVLSAVLVAMVLTGCAETAPVGDMTAAETQQQTTPVADVAVAETEQETTPETTQSDTSPATIEETVMWDGDDLKVTALRLTSDQYYHILSLRFDNKTNKDIYVMASRAAVNSFVVEPWLGVEVPAGGTAEDDLKFWLKDVAADVIADIETRFTYSSTDSYVKHTTARVKLETSAAASYDYSYDESGTVLYDANGIKIICQGFNDEGNPMIYVSSTGELSEGCCVEELEVYINDRLTDSDYFAWVFPNTRNIAEMELEKTDREGNALGDVESLKVSFKISKENVADSKPVKTELVEIPIP